MVLILTVISTPYSVNNNFIFMLYALFLYSIFDIESVIYPSFNYSFLQLGRHIFHGLKFRWKYHFIYIYIT